METAFQAVKLFALDGASLAPNALRAVSTVFNVSLL